MATLADLQGQRQQFFKQKGEQQQGQIQGEIQGNVEALQRRFTSMGAANTGASIAAEQKARDAGLAQQRQATTDLAGQQLQAGEGDIARQAQTEESALGRAFAGQQAQLGQTFQGEQARLGREASLGEAGAARAFQEKMANQDIGFKRELASTEQGNKLKEMDMAYQQFLIDKDTTAFNKRLSAIQAGIDPNTVGAMDGTSGSFQTIGQTEAEKSRSAEQKRAETLVQATGGGSKINTTDEFIDLGEYTQGSGKFGAVRIPKLSKNPNYIRPNPTDISMGLTSGY